MDGIDFDSLETWERRKILNTVFEADGLNLHLYIPLTGVLIRLEFSFFQTKYFTHVGKYKKTVQWL